jgi:alpha-L-rhamnosidase
VDDKEVNHNEVNHREVNDQEDISVAIEVPRRWHARFIAGPRSHAEQPGPAPYFRREFEAGAGLLQARLHVTALGVVEVHLNGAGVGDEVLCPGWTSYRHRLEVSSHDVTSSVLEGRNAVGAVVGEGWAVGRIGFAGQRALWSDRPAAFVQLELDYGDRTELVCSDEHWRTSTGAWLADGIYDGETYDARLTPRGWAESGFDDTEWEPVHLVEWDRGTLESREAPPIRRTQELPANGVFISPGGATVVDFGQVLSGRVRVRVEGPAGTEVTIRHCELLVGGEPEFETNRTAAATDRYVLRGNGTEVWEPAFTFHGFRYAVVEGWPGEPGEIGPDAFTAVVVHTDMEKTGWFETSDERLNRLHENVVWSFRGNAVGIPTDCPQRDERLGWTGDINAFGPTAAFLYDVRNFLASWLADLAAEQREQGNVPMVVPDVTRLLPSTPTALWGDVAVSLPWTLFVEYGDLHALRCHYPSMKAFVESVVPLLDESGTWTRGFQFGDWLDPDAPPENPRLAKTETGLVATAYFCRTLDQMASAARVLGHHDDEARCASLRERVAAGFRREWVTPSGRIANETQTAYSLAICFGLLGPEQEQHAGDRLAELTFKAGYHIGTGFAGTPWLLPALSRTGHTDVAYQVLTQTTPPSFLYPVTMGATTIWERWDSVLPDGTLNSTGMTSLNHYALGAVADWLHRVVGGIEPVEPGYRRCRIAPQPGRDLTWARTAHDTTHGRIQVSWEATKDRRAVRVEVPPGVEAEVVLPDHADGLVAVVGTGMHEWEYAPAPGSADGYPLDTPFSVLRADPETWERVAAVVNQLVPGVDNLIDYVEQQHPHLQSMLEDMGDRPDLEQDFRQALAHRRP